MAPLTVACVLKTGGDFDFDYVEQLRDGVREHLHVDHRFVCLTNAPDYSVCDCVKMRYDYPGWWSKLELFSAFRGNTLYFDLDTIINGPIDELADTANDGLYMLNDVGRYERPMSGVMAWGWDLSYITAEFLARDFANIKTIYMDRDRGSQGGPWGDGGYIAHTYAGEPGILQVAHPGMIVSYKWQAPEERKNASVICYHGDPRPRATGWAA